MTWARSTFVRRLQTPSALLAGIAAAAGVSCDPAWSTPISVRVLPGAGSAVQLRIDVAAGIEPVLAWSGTAGAAPYPLALIWSDANLHLAAPLPALPLEPSGPLASIALHTVGTSDRLEVMVREPVYPKLRRIGSTWILDLDPETPRADFAQVPAAGFPASRTSAAPLAAPPVTARRGAVQSVESLTSHLVAPAAGIAPAQAIAHGKAAHESLLVDLTVNGLRQPEIARAEQSEDGRLLVAAENWNAARLLAPGPPALMSDGTPAYPLEAVAGLRYSVNRQRMSIDVDAPAGAFAASALQAPQSSQQSAPHRPTPGAFVNYDVTAMHGADNSSTAAAAFEVVGFGPFGTVAASALASDDGTKRRLARLDTSWQLDMPESMQTLVLGDTVASGSGWSRPVRYAGLRWGRDFGLRPEFVTMPLPSISGEAALPSTVDLLVNDSRKLSQSVRPGPFDITNVPVITGSGELNLVVSDLLGRQTVIHRSYYASPRLLAPGLTDFSLEAGWLRTGYAADSRYRGAMAAATLRRGLSKELTGEGRLELERDRRAAGLDLSGLLGTWGLGRMAMAASGDRVRGTPEHGALVQLGLERSTPSGGARIQYAYASRGFAPLGESPDPGAPARRPREQLLVTIGGRLTGPLSAGASYVRRVQWDGASESSLGLTLNAPVGPATVTLAVNRRLVEGHDWGGSINLNLPLGADLYSGARVERQEDGHATASLLAVRTAPAGPGVGWRVEASTEARQRMRAGLQYNSNHGDVTAEVVSDADTQVSARAGARGTLGIMAGLPFASRPVGEGSFAVVQLDGMPQVPVKRSNHVVAITDDRGLAFVPDLVP